MPPKLFNTALLVEQSYNIAARHERLDVEILEQDEMEALGMNALLAVARGSTNPPRLIRLRWNGGDSDQPALALVGKGVTFDTGGISIKPGKDMDQMKFDMGGAAATLGAMEAVARLKLPINVEGVVGAVENMPDGKDRKSTRLNSSHV